MPVESSNLIEKILSVRKPSEVKVTETYARPEVLKVLSTVDTTAEGFKDIVNFLWDDQPSRFADIFKKQKNAGSVTHTMRKDTYGRYYYSGRFRLGLQNLYRPVRRLVCDGECTEIDLVNCHVNLLCDLCESYGIACHVLKNYRNNRASFLDSVTKQFGCDRDAAKCFFLICIFGGSFKTWAEKCGIAGGTPTGLMKQFLQQCETIAVEFSKIEAFKPVLDFAKSRRQGKTEWGYKFSALGYLLQEIESTVITLAMDHLKSEGVEITALIHDGVAVKNSEAVNQELLDEMALTINCATGLSSVAFDFKPLAPTEEDLAWYEAHQKFVRAGSGSEKRTDVIHAELFLEERKGKVFDTSCGLYMYDDQSGIWSGDEKTVSSVVKQVAEHTFINRFDGDERKPLVSLMKNAMTWIKSGAPRDDAFFTGFADIGYLCFRNGVLDMATGELLPHSPDYKFVRRIERDWDPDTDYTEGMEQIMERMFKKTFTDDEKREYFLEFLGRSAAGCVNYVDRQFAFMVGPTACGKGILMQLLENSFGNLVAEFNANYLLAKSARMMGSDEAKNLSWLVDIHDCRFAISSEVDGRTEDETNSFGRQVKKQVGLNQEVIKKVVSGGETMSARALYQNPKSFKMKAGVFILVNDIPRPQKADKAYLDRCNVIEADRSSAAIAEDTETHFVRDNSIKDFIADPYIRDSFIALLCSYYAERRKYFGLPEAELTPKPDSVKAATAEWSGVNDPDSADNWLANNYEHYADEDGRDVKDLVPFWVKGAKVQRCDWDKVGDWYIRFDTLYEFFSKKFPGESPNGFSRRLTDAGLVKAAKKVRGKTVTVVVGLRPARAAQPAFIDDDE